MPLCPPMTVMILIDIAAKSLLRLTCHESGMNEVMN